MAGVAGSGSLACGHPAQPGSRFCPVCGEPATGSSPPPQPESEAWDDWYAPRWPPPQPSGPQPWPAPPVSVQPPPAGPDTTRVDGLGPVPPGDLPAATLDDLTPGDLPLAPAASGPRRSRRPLVPVIVAAVIAAVVAGFVIFGTRSGGTAASGTTGTTPSTSSQGTQRQAAVRLSGLLAQSVTDRAAVINAVADVRGCGPSLRQDARTFARAAGSRQRLLSRLGSLPGRSLLPAAMLQDLTGAWQASARVDTDLAQWADDSIASGCHRDSQSDASLLASAVPEDQANAGKHAFASLWNPVARRYGLATYQPNQF
jgi:hypothetical protein